MPDPLPPSAATGPGAPGPVRDLTAEEYNATYADGEPHQLPLEVLDALPRPQDEDG